MIKHQIILDYALAAGWMKPFVDGLIAGRAVALKCTSCTHVSYPPQRTCTCGEASSDWVTLSGDADIIFRTTGSDGDFGLVQFDGADTQAVVRLEMFSAVSQRGQIAKSEGSLQKMILEPIQNEAS